MDSYSGVTCGDAWVGVGSERTTMLLDGSPRVFLRLLRYGEDFECLVSTPPVAPPSKTDCSQSFPQVARVVVFVLLIHSSLTTWDERV